MARITITDLRNAVSDINDRLEDMGSTTRFREQGRNGYQAVDQYDVEQFKSCGAVQHCVAAGTSRECIDGLNEAFCHVQNDHIRKQQAELCKLARLIKAAVNAQVRYHNNDTTYTSNPEAAADRATDRVERAAKKLGCITTWPGLFPVFHDIKSHEIKKLY